MYCLKFSILYFQCSFPLQKIYTNVRATNGIIEKYNEKKNPVLNITLNLKRHCIWMLSQYWMFSSLYSQQNLLQYILFFDDYILLSVSFSKKKISFCFLFPSLSRTFHVSVKFIEIMPQKYENCRCTCCRARLRSLCMTIRQPTISLVFVWKPKVRTTRIWKAQI